MEHRALEAIVRATQKGFARLGHGHIVPETWVSAPTDAWQTSWWTGIITQVRRAWRRIRGMAW